MTYAEQNVWLLLFSVTDQESANTDQNANEHEGVENMTGILQPTSSLRGNRALAEAVSVVNVPCSPITERF